MNQSKLQQLGQAAVVTTRVVARATRAAALTAKRFPWRRLRPRTRQHAGILGILLLVLAWFTSPSNEVVAASETWTRRELLRAIHQVESSGRSNPPDGDGGRAIGPYQIHYVYWLDATSFDPELGGDYQQCRQLDYAEQVIDAYMRRYAKSAWQQGIGETIAKVHNGGPKGHQKLTTEGYWQRVRKHLPPPQ